jgi:hypothetical protein
MSMNWSKYKVEYFMLYRSKMDADPAKTEMPLPGWISPEKQLTILALAETPAALSCAVEGVLVHVDDG